MSVSSILYAWERRSHIDSVEVDHMNVAKAEHCQIGQDLAAQATSSDDEDLAFVSQKVLRL